MPFLGRSWHQNGPKRRQSVWNSIDSMTGAAAAITSSKRASGATMAIAGIRVADPSGRSIR
jgi:hypothetical protein